MQSRLGAVLDPKDVVDISHSLAAINNLTAEQQTTVREAFAEGYNQQNIFLAVVTALFLVTACFLWDRKTTQGTRPDRQGYGSSCSLAEETGLIGDVESREV